MEAITQRKLTASEVAHVLGCRSPRSSSGWYNCSCPCTHNHKHGDKNPSLGLRDGEDGNLAVYCQTGCKPREIYEALRARDISFYQKEFRPHVVGGLMGPSRKGKKQVVAEYHYYSESGEVLYTKIKYPKDNDPPFRYDQKGVSEKFVLYNLPMLKVARENGWPVYLCEGEKDVESVNSLDLVGTTNPEGASVGAVKWRDSYTQALAGLDIVIFEDNDNAGRNHAQGVAALLYGRASSVKIVSFPELPEKGDVSDYLQDHNKDDLLARVEQTPIFVPPQEIAKVLDGFSPDEEQQSNKRQKNATFEDVKQLIRDTFPDKPPRTDLFSGKLHVWHKGRWMKVGGEGLIDKLETIMRHSGGFFQHAGLKAAIHTYADELTPEFLIDIPAWDGRDRVSELADACNITNIPKEYFGQFLKAWGAKMFQRAYDNRKHQNNCIILKGGQGIGKDRFIDALVGGLGMYADNYSPTNDEVRKAMILSSLLVVKVPEFERLNKTDPDVLKNDITSDGTSTVGKYGKEVGKFEYRCSWIASANTFDFFRDHTGNRRFWVFVIDGKPGEAIRWGYPDSQSDKLQILAQFRQLAAEGYEVSADAKSEMDRYIARMTPEDPAEVLVCDFDIFVTEKIGELGLRMFDKVDHKGWSDVWMIPNHYLESWGIFDRLARLHGIAPRRIQATLKGRDRDWKTGAKGRGYLALDTAVTLVTDEKEDVSLDVSLPNV